MLQCVIPEIESIQAMNDQQVLEYIRTNIIPMLQQVLPESGRPPILIRKFTWTGSGNTNSSNNNSSGNSINSNSRGDDDLTLVWWFQGMLWSQIYVGGCGRLGRQGLGAWYETGVRMFSVRTMTSSSTSATTAMTVTENMSTVAAAAIKAGSTFATSSFGSGTGSLNHRTSTTVASGGGAGNGAASRRTSGQSNSSSSARRPSSSSTPTASTGPDATSAGSASRKSSSGSISKDALRNV